MTDLIERLQKSMCEPNMGCGTQPMCLCAVVDEAITRIKELEGLLTEQTQEENKNPVDQQGKRG